MAKFTVVGCLVLLVWMIGAATQQRDTGFRAPDLSGGAHGKILNAGVDCYGTEASLAHVVAVRNSGNDYMAMTTRLQELFTQDGTVMDVGQDFVVTQVDGNNIKLLLKNGIYDDFRCWAFRPDLLLAVATFERGK